VKNFYNTIGQFRRNTIIISFCKNPMIKIKR
jgi:hypothetical protein